MDIPFHRKGNRDRISGFRSKLPRSPERGPLNRPSPVCAPPVSGLRSNPNFDTNTRVEAGFIQFKFASLGRPGQYIARKGRARSVWNEVLGLREAYYVFCLDPPRVKVKITKIMPGSLMRAVRSAPSGLFGSWWGEGVAGGSYLNRPGKGWVGSLKRS